MKLADTLAAKFFDAARVLDAGVCLVNGEVQFSAHRELLAGDEIEIAIPDCRKWKIQTVLERTP